MACKQGKTVKKSGRESEKPPVRDRPMPLRQAVLPVSLILAYLVLPFSCARFVPADRSAEALSLPSAFTLYEESAPAPDRWWEVFSAPDLGPLIDQALAGNLTLRQVEARLTQAEMLYRQAGAALWPELNLSGEVSAVRRRTETHAPSTGLSDLTQKINALDTLVGAPGAGVTGALDTAQRRLEAADFLLNPPSTSATSVSHSYRFGLSSGYEVDLWGRVRAREKAARLDYEASQEDLYAARLSLSGAVAQQWLVIVALQQELEVVSRQLELNKTTQELIELRYRKGLANALDVYQQRQIVAQTEAFFPPLEAAVQTARHELAALLGEPPRTGLPVETRTLPILGALPDPGLPADLLGRRPDVRAAGLSLKSADWYVSAARADRLPALRLTPSASYGAEEWSLVFDNWVAALTGSLTGPVFDAGRRKAEVERTRAVAEERLAAYRQQVLDSVKEVETAMLQDTKQGEYLEALGREIEAARAAHKQALERYRKGLNDYLPVLSALMQLQGHERRMVEAELVRLEWRVRLYLALGGAWMQEEPRVREN
jgi:NodT family efflux transporter outer membrane factor (OMF) lipoprotein